MDGPTRPGTARMIDVRTIYVRNGDVRMINAGGAVRQARPRISTADWRMSTLRTLPVTVMGNSSTTWT